MTSTFLAAMAIGALAPVPEPELTASNAVFHDPVIAPFSELILFHASVEKQTKNHSLWLIAEQGKGRRIAQEAVDPVCIGVLPDRPVAVVADHTTPHEQYWLASLRTGEVLAKVPDYDLRIRRTLRDQLTNNLLLVATDEDGALGLYRFPVNAWYQAAPEDRANYKPKKVWSLTSDPEDLVFSRDGSRVAMLQGSDIKLLTIGETVTSRTLAFPGTVLYPRDFHPTLNLLMYESVKPMSGFVDPFGEIGMLDLTTGHRRTAMYFPELLEPTKNPRFDSSGSFMLIDALADGIQFKDYSAGNKVEHPRPVGFWINLARPEVSFYNHYGSGSWPLGESMQPLCVGYSSSRLRTKFYEPTRQFADFEYGLARADKTYWTTWEHREGVYSGHYADFESDWIATAEFSPTAAGKYVDLLCGFSVGILPPWLIDANVSILYLIDVRKKLHFPGRNVPPNTDVALTDDIVLFGSPISMYNGLKVLRNYPNWSHYGP